MKEARIVVRRAVGARTALFPSPVFLSAVFFSRRGIHIS